MLSLKIKSGEYVIIGETVVIQVFQRSGSQLQLAIQAPKELPIMRGEVYERAGKARPENVFDASHASAVRQHAGRMQRSEMCQKAAAIRADAVQQLRTLLHETDACDAIQQAVSAQLNRLEQAETIAEKGGAALDGTTKKREMDPQHNHQSAP